MDPKYYFDIYLIIVTLFTLFITNGIQSDTFLFDKERRQQVPTTLLSLFFIIFIGFRPISYVFVDMVNYNQYYNFILGNPFVFTTATDNIIFDNLLNYLAGSYIDIRFLFLFMAALYFTGIVVACNKLFPNNALLAFLVYLAAFSTFSYGTNGLKAGVAASLFLIAVAYKQNKLILILFILLSFGFHHSMVLPIVAFVMATFYKNTKMFLLGWFTCVLISLAHITFFQTLLAGFSDEQGAGYLMSESSDWGGKTGFRIDFVIYSAMPVLMGYWVIIKQRVESYMYKFIFNIYLVTNSVWMLCMYAEFTNRIAYLSWFMYPIVLIYPLLRLEVIPNQSVLLKKVVFAHLGFTLFMHIIYY